MNPTLKSEEPSNDVTAVQLNMDAAKGDYRRSERFRRAGLTLLEQACSEPDWRSRDELIWPALYCLRHYFELAMKMLIRDSPSLALGAAPRGHDLRKLWRVVAPGFRKVFAGEEPEDSALAEAVSLLTALDPRGDGFRYSTDVRGRPSSMRIAYLEPMPVLELMKRAAREVTGIETGFHEHHRLLVEMREEFGDWA